MPKFQSLNQLTKYETKNAAEIGNSLALMPKNAV